MTNQCLITSRKQEGEVRSGAVSQSAGWAMSEKRGEQPYWHLRPHHPDNREARYLAAQQGSQGTSGSAPWDDWNEETAVVSSHYLEDISSDEMMEDQYN